MKCFAVTHGMVHQCVLTLHICVSLHRVYNRVRVYKYVLGEVYTYVPLTARYLSLRQSNSCSKAEVLYVGNVLVSTTSLD